MRIVLILVYLCSLLFSGANYSYAGAMPNSVVYSSPHYNTSHDNTSFKNGHQDEEVKCLVNINFDDDEDDEDSSLVKKFRLPVKYEYAHSFRPVSNYLHNCRNSLPLFYFQTSPKYIVQKVLRI